MKYRIILLLLTALVLNAHAQLTDRENYTTTQKGRFLLCILPILLLAWKMAAQYILDRGVILVPLWDVLWKLRRDP